MSSGRVHPTEPPLPTSAISGVELRRIRLPLVAPFRSSLGLLWEREVLLVKVTTSDGEGWGECAAMAAPSYTSEYLDGAHHVMRHHLLPLLLARPGLRADEVAGALAPVRGHSMAKSALEMAVLDAELRSTDTSLAERLGAVRAKVDAGVAVGIAGDLGELVDAVAGYRDAGYRRVKLKIRPGWDVEPVQAVRARFGDQLALQVDANAGYSRADAAHLGRLDAFDLVLIEQPFAEDDLLGHAELARRISTPICLDESITSAAAASTAIALGAAAVVNVKAGRVGGYLEARKVHDVCAAAGVPVWCGGMFETGVGRAANVALAALPNFALPGDVSASDRYYRADLTPPFVLEDGRLAVPTGPGLGVEVLADAVDEFTVSVERVTTPARGSTVTPS
ncbi:MAG: o-succinylbenzoate synthase [Actinomycetota bacterium]|nr:o-succinylbenzoate synthase [Actinomycetota bacterium]